MLVSLLPEKLQKEHRVVLEDQVALAALLLEDVLLWVALAVDILVLALLLRALLEELNLLTLLLEEMVAIEMADLAAEDLLAITLVVAVVATLVEVQVDYLLVVVVT